MYLNKSFLYYLPQHIVCTFLPEPQVVETSIFTIFIFINESIQLFIFISSVILDFVILLKTLFNNRFNFSLDYLFKITKQNGTSYFPLDIDLNVIVQNLRKSHNLTQKKNIARKKNTSQASYAHYKNSVNLIPTTFIYNPTDIYKTFSIDKLLGRKK